MRRSKGEATTTSRLAKVERKKVAKKSLNLEFDSIVEEESFDCSKVLSDGVYFADQVKKWNDNQDPSLVSEVSNGSHTAESCVVDIRASTSPDVYSVVELTPISKMTTDVLENLEDVRAKCLEADIVAEHLKYALLLIQNAAGIDNKSKKLVDILIKTVIEEFYGIPDEHDMLSKIVKAKTHIVATCLVLWMICTLVAVYVKCHASMPFIGPLPT